MTTADLPAGSSEPADGLTILIVDDNRDAAETLAMLLSLKGFTVRCAADGPAALAMAAETPPDVVILDIGLPGMDGYETAARLRALPALRTARLLALSGYGQDEDRTRAREAGFDAYLVKPVDARALDESLGA